MPFLSTTPHKTSPTRSIIQSHAGEIIKSQPLSLQLATRLHATREVVAGEDDLEVVSDEGAHVAVRVANLVLRLVRLHHDEIGIGALDRLVGRTVYH